MTISSLTRTAGPFTGTGSASVFPFAFKVFQASDLLVAQTLVATMVQTNLVLTTDYKVTLNASQDGNPGGSITLVAGALPVGSTLILTSAVANLQPTEFLNQGGFYPEVLTASLDRLTILIQQMQVTINALGVQPCVATVVGTVYTAPAQVAAVFVNGALEPPTTYSAPANVITFTYTLDPGDVVNALCTGF